MTEPAAQPPFHRKNPFLAELVERYPLTKAGSAKDTQHFVLSLAGSEMAYTPGDSLAIFACNPPELVEEVLRCLELDPEAEVDDPKGGKATFRFVLQRRCILNRASKKILSGLGEVIPQGEQRNRLMELADNDELVGEYIHTRDYVDVLRDFDEARFSSPEEFISQLAPIPPRLYSIASSLAAHPGEVHLCIGVVRYETHGRSKKGLCSGYMADHAPLREKCIPVYVQESKSFRLPQDGARDIVMVGPGTGIAPFRAFLEQRQLDGATGRHWLFFGEQHRATDYLYGDEFEKWHRDGFLHRLDLAFSRDQEQKVYVQHLMKRHGRDLWDWLQGGAYLYVCGDAKRMAKDVHQAIIEIAMEHGGHSEEQAAEYVRNLMREEKRYLRDVY